LDAKPVGIAAPLETIVLARPQAAGLPAVLKAGEIVTGEILSLLDGGKISIEIKGRVVTAQTNLPLSAGQTVDLRVSDVGPNVILSLVPPPGEEALAAGRIKSLIGQAPALSQAVEDLLGSARALVRGPEGSVETGAAALFSKAGASLGGEAGRLLDLVGARLAQLPVTGDKVPPDFVPRLIETLGLAHEAVLRASVERPGRLPEAMEDLKGLLLSLKERLEARSSPAAGAEAQRPDGGAQAPRLAAQAADGFVKAVELAQWQNIVSRAQDGPILLNVPFAFPDGMSAGELRIHRDGKKDRGQDDDGPTTVVLLLDMTGLGPIRIDAWISPKRAAVRVTVSEEDAAGFVSGLLPELAGRLSAMGYETHAMCGVAAKGAGSAGPDAPPIPAGILDIRA
jgi:hypothetical protein